MALNTTKRENEIRGNYQDIQEIITRPFFIISIDFDEAYVLIDRALKSTKDHEMDYLRKEVNKLKDQLVSEYNTLKDLFERDTSVSDRLESSSLMDLLRDTTKV